MKGYVQHTTDTPQGSIEFDSALWSSIPKKDVPTGGEILDDVQGWVAGLDFQGIDLSGWDHYHVLDQPSDNSVTITLWNDDPDEWLGDFHAQVWELFTPQADVRIGNRINTRQRLTVYAELIARQELWQNKVASLGLVAVKPWTEFTIPAGNEERHGIRVSKEKFAEIQAIRRSTDWRDWIE